MSLFLPAPQPLWPDRFWPHSRARNRTTPMGFFVTSTPIGDGANLGGLQGADAHCQKLAAASGQAGAGERVWRAYLSTQGPNAVNARDRIGAGPWANARGGIVARDVAHLHGDTVELAQLGSNLTQDDGNHREEHDGAWRG